EGDWELGEASGEDLGLSIIAAQDFACLLQLEGDLLPADARASIEAWIEVAEEAPLDAGAVKLLETFLDCFPLPEEYRLGIVDSPLTQAERALVVRGLPSPPVVEVTLRTAAAVMPELQLAYAGAAPSSLISSFELTDEAVDAGPAGCFTLSRRLHEDWRVVVDLLALGGESAAARAMRLGTFPGSRGSDEEPWVVNLSHAPIAERIAALGRPLFFQLRDGTRLRIVCLPKDSHRA
ncbi:MAG: hypothetical protein NTY65_04695, partial [Planctomycetota bacterium]|nr:hypothetical protein [Planctomycetota bacterium]